jgi:hypothetical protein
MNEGIEKFREILRLGLKGGRFYLPTATGRIVQFYFTRDQDTKKYILQCYDGHHWLWTSYDNESKGLIKDFDEIIYQYTDL